MKKRKRYTYFFVFAILITFYFSFFYMERTEIGDVDILLVVGIDKNDEGYQLTALYNKNGGVDEATGGAKVIEGTGSSIYAAYNNMVTRNIKNISIAHATHYILSEEVAKSGVRECFDFIQREQTAKMNATVYLLQNSSVNEYMKKTVENESSFMDDLRAISNRQLDELKEVDNTISDIVRFLSKENQTFFIPYLVNNEDELYVGGYGAIKDNIFVTYLDTDQSRTLDFVRNRTRTYPVYLDNQVCLEITDSSVNRKVKIKNGNVEVDVNATFESDVKEVTSTDDVFEEYYIERLEQMQNYYMEQQMQNLLQVAAENKIDVLDILEGLRVSYTNDWDTVSKHWNKYVSNILYHYNISSQAAQSYVCDN